MNELLDLALLRNHHGAVADLELGAGGKIAGKNNLPRPRRNVHEAAGSRRDMGPDGELGHVDGAEAIDLQEREQRRVESAALEVGELSGRWHDRLGVGG